MADALFSEPRLAELYDPLDPGRSDLDVYVAMAGLVVDEVRDAPDRPGLEFVFIAGEPV